MKAQGFGDSYMLQNWSQHIVTPWFAGLLHGQLGISAWAQGLWTGLSVDNDGCR